MSSLVKQHHIDWECPIENMLDGKNRMKTKSLFAETLGRPQIVKGFLPTYTLYERDKYWTVPSIHPTHAGEQLFLPSAYLIYMASVDEYEAGMKLTGSSKHWQALSSVSWFTNKFQMHKGIEEWREDMRLRDLSKAKRVLEQAAEEGNVTAAKALYGESKTKKSPGRPKKEKENKGREETEDIDSLYNNVFSLEKRK